MHERETGREKHIKGQLYTTCLLFGANITSPLFFKGVEMSFSLFHFLSKTQFGLFLTTSFGHR